MDKLPAELTYVLLFALVALVQYVLKRFSPKKPPQAPQGELLPEEVPGEDIGEAQTELMVPRVTDGRFGRAGVPNSSPATSGRRYSRASLMGTQRDVQNAIVIATILGPCRTFEPYDAR